MRTEQLEYVAAVARLGSFRRAAEELHISQPALSTTVRNLERELGVDLLDRGRAGAKVTDVGRELLPHIAGVTDAVDRLRQAADDRHRTSRMVRLGTVNAATVPLLTPTIRRFRETHPSTQVEVVGAQQDQIHRALLEGSFDLGLVTCLGGDDMPPELETTRLVRGRAVVCMRPDSPLAARASIAAADLLSEQLIVMRAGYLMHRFVHRLLEGRIPSFSYSTDGAEMGKLMVAEGLGACLLPDFSVVGDPLERCGLITYRPLAGDDTEVLLVIQRCGEGSASQAARDLREIFVQRARAYEGSRPMAGARAVAEDR
jgi:DNA-binding transcriptional LysR family regulator